MMDIERAPRAELLKTIEQQKELIQRREQRLRDVITAYKGVCKEKEALESSIKVLSQAKSRGQLDVPHSKGPSSDTASDRGQESDRETEDGSAGDQEFVDPLNASNSQNAVGRDDASSNAVDELQQQVETLSNSLLTLTQEKSKSEANYIAEKKVIKQENEELQKKVKDCTVKIEKLEHDIQQQQLEWKNRVRTQQIEREKEQTDHAVMLRELQKLLANERQAKEQLEHQYDEVQFSLKEQERLIPEITSKHEQQIVSLKEEINSLNQQLKQAQLKSLEPSPMLLSLQKETEDLKAQHNLMMQEDEDRAKDVEFKAQAYSVQCETRIAELESKLSELSETVGNYERLRFQDQQTVQKLKERISQLDQENTVLAEASTAKSVKDEDITDIPTLVEKITALKTKLKVANSQTDQPVNIGELLLDDSDSEHPLCKKYREELEQVKDEFERYRLRAQSVLKNKKENTSSKDEDILKEHVNELREKLRTMHIQQEEEIDHYKQREENLRKTMLMLQEKHKQEVTHLQAEHHSQLQEFEEEIKKQRDRTVSMLAEKERELEVLRSSSSQRIQSDYLMRYRANHDMGGASSERQSTEDEAVTRLLATPPSGQGEMTLLYFAQEQARKDVDINALRKQKRELELALRDLQVSSATKQEQLYEQIDRLKEEIRKLDRSISREGANLEYLKNVTYKFLICHDPVGKQQMLNAITTILQFSPQEKTTVQAQNRGWWGSSA
ncbi:GRIP and coiled-coil domain-containing protein 1-like [Mercenaria mercenaria]|uniref:GRIP and coiled-coil domain-containing protein 1-like n=1 Tax=Mercenaria mercenaria TaxID=6596 RepID=UPI00234E500F|nr:GRIP and coiled-coil domain-containing protein 1-like [Mercenaria mercenaria]XP_053394076.1 GRIP and coiled-coil domain-containing protein 1-like [Mercenaria mercenaria]XP_053394077.1 GRIP and coiled-coil domain-containing protein 1-like [Mercenaria mercenaria]XP_053394078.1 GRIP and coiled-coil domain-containing protein 1-like [Mercenaria mercenaria]